MADPHPGLSEQRQQEPIPGPNRRRQHRDDLLGAERARRPLRDRQLHGTRRDRPPPSDVVQERLVGAATNLPPRHQPRCDLHPATSVIFVEPEDRRQMPIHRRRRPSSRATIKNDHIRRRRPKPRHEPSDLVDADLSPIDTDGLEELEPQLQTRRVRTLRVRRSLQRRQIRKERVRRLDR